MAAITYLEAIREALHEEMVRDRRVFLIGEDIGVYGGAFKITQGFQEEFGMHRVVDTPIAEAAIVGAAVGSALMGLRPVAEMQFMDFVSCAFDPLVNWAAKCRYRWGKGVPLVVRGPAGGGTTGGPFHGQNVESYFANVAGLKLVSAATARSAKGLLKAAIRDEDPVLFFEYKALYRRPELREEMPVGDFVIPLGKAEVVREGRDVTVVTWGTSLHPCLEAASRLAEESMDCEVIDLRTLIPWDRERVMVTVKKTNRALVVHEAPELGGFGGEIAAAVQNDVFEWLDAPVRRLGAPYTPIPFAPSLEKAFLPDAEKVIAALRELHAW